MIRLSIIFFGLFLLTSCGNDEKIPAGILKPEKMQAVLWDVIKADAFTTGYIKNDSAKNAVEENLKLQQEIFTIHKVTKADFYNSYDYYKKNIGRFKIMLDSMIIQAERNQKSKIMPVQAE